MDDAVVLQVRLCPDCRTERQLSELFCEHIRADGETCGQPLMDVPVIRGGQEHPKPTKAGPAPEAAARRCQNGHEMSDDVEICMVCGADAAPDDAPSPTGPEPEPIQETVIDGWHVLRRLDPADEASPQQRYVVQRIADVRDGTLTLFEAGHALSTASYEAGSVWRLSMSLA